MLKKCLDPTCENVFETVKQRGRPKIYCSARCKMNHMRDKGNMHEYDGKMGRCKYDGSLFTKTRSDQLFASVENKTKWHNNKNKEICDRIEPNKPVMHFTCDYCGKEYDSTSKKSRFCGSTCRSIFYRQYRMPDYVTKRMNFDIDDAIDRDQIGHIYIDCDFTGSDFSYTDCTRARFIRCSFTDCNFTRSTFEGVDLIDCNFEGMNIFDGAVMTLTKLPYSPNLKADLINKSKTGHVSEQRYRLLNNLRKKVETFDD